MSNISYSDLVNFDNKKEGDSKDKSPNVNRPLKKEIPKQVSKEIQKTVASKPVKKTPSVGEQQFKKENNSTREMRKIFPSNQIDGLFIQDYWKKSVKKRTNKSLERTEINVNLEKGVRISLHGALVNSLLEVYADNFGMDVSRKKDLSDFRTWLITYLLVKNLPDNGDGELYDTLYDTLLQNELFQQIAKKDNRSVSHSESNSFYNQQLEEMQQTNLANQRAISLIIARIFNQTPKSIDDTMNIEKLLLMDGVLNVQNGVGQSGENEQRRLKTMKNKPKYK